MAVPHGFVVAVVASLRVVSTIYKNNPLVRRLLLFFRMKKPMNGSATSSLKLIDLESSELVLVTGGCEQKESKEQQKSKPIVPELQGKLL